MYGRFGKRIEVFEMWREAQKHPALLGPAGLGVLTEAEVETLAEGTGAPEGRADFPYFLQTIIRHKYRSAFRAVDSPWRDYVGIEDAQDFRETSTSSLNGIVGWEAVDEFGEIPRGRSSESPGPSYQVVRHEVIYGVTYELIINDATGTILNRVPTELGASAGWQIARDVVSQVEANANYIDGVAFFHASRGNLYTGSAANITEDNIATIVGDMKLHLNEDGEPFNLVPQTFVVKTFRQRLRILQTIRSGQTVQQETGISNSVFARGSDNPLGYPLPELSNLKVSEDQRLSSATNWFLFADAQGRAAFVVAFLRGQQQPQIFVRAPEGNGALNAGQDPYTWEGSNIEYKGRWVYGTAQGEPLAVAKMVP